MQVEDCINTTLTGLSGSLENVEQSQPRGHCRPLCLTPNTAAWVRIKDFNIQEAEHYTAHKQQKIYMLPMVWAPQVTRNWSVKAHLNACQQMIHVPCHKGGKNLANLIWWKIPSWPQCSSPFDAQPGEQDTPASCPRKKWFLWLSQSTGLSETVCNPSLMFQKMG